VLSGAITRHPYKDRQASFAVITAVPSLSIWQEDSHHNILCGCLLLALQIVRSFSTSQRPLDLFAEPEGWTTLQRLLIHSRNIVFSNRHFLSVAMAGSREESCWEFLNDSSTSLGSFRMSIQPNSILIKGFVGHHFLLF